MTLTPKQQELFDYLEDYIERNGIAPAIREQAKAMGLKSPAPIQYRLEALQKRGYIDWMPDKARSIRILKPSRRKGVPIVGAIAAGWVEAFADEEVNAIPYEFFKSLGRSAYEISQYLAVRVRGDSMIDAHIASGDVVILKPPSDSKSIKDGTIVAARVDDKMTLKYYQRLDKRTVRLQPANPNYEPLDVPVKQLEIQGVYVASTRGLI